LVFVCQFIFYDGSRKAETTNAKNVVEIRASNGCSGLWLCLALQSTVGNPTSFEMDHRRAELARENFKPADVENISHSLRVMPIR
jgi:predicted O-methyltransferase YrrM